MSGDQWGRPSSLLVAIERAFDGRHCLQDLQGPQDGSGPLSAVYVVQGQCDMFAGCRINPAFTVLLASMDEEIPMTLTNRVCRRVRTGLALRSSVALLRRVLGSACTS